MPYSGYLMMLMIRFPACRLIQGPMATKLASMPAWPEKTPETGEPTADYPPDFHVENPLIHRLSTCNLPRFSQGGTESRVNYSQKNRLPINNSSPELPKN
jgi:hypothetical protein